MLPPTINMNSTKRYKWNIDNSDVKNKQTARINPSQRHGRTIIKSLFIFKIRLGVQWLAQPLLNVADRVLDLGSCLAKDCKMDMYYFSAKYTALRSMWGNKTGWLGIRIMCISRATYLPWTVGSVSLHYNNTSVCLEQNRHQSFTGLFSWR